MARTLNTEYSDKLTDDVLYPRILVKLDVDSGPVLAWSGIGDLTYNSETYQGVGDLGAVNSVSEGSELEVPSIELTLNGIPTTNRDIADTENHQLRAAFINLAMFDSDGISMTSENQVQNIFTGTISNMAGNIGAEVSTIVVRCKSWFANLDRIHTRDYTATDWQIDHADDHFFDFVARLPERAEEFHES